MTNKNSLDKNIGEWSEFYTLLYLLGRRKLTLADKSLNPLVDMDLPILKIIRHDKNNEPIEFVIKDFGMIELYKSNELVKTFKSDYFSDKAEKLLNDIKTHNSKKAGAFWVPQAYELLHELYLKSVTATSSEVTDILMQIHDILTGQEPIVGYSIKSYLGGAPTLLNAGKTTNFVYKISGLTNDDMEVVNAIETSKKLLDRMELISKKGGKIEFSHVLNSVFEDNLTMLDSTMPQIIGNLLLVSYTRNIVDCGELVQILENENPFGYKRKGLYEYKFKKLLSAKALGMNPSEPWNGYDLVNGGYIVVTDVGNVLAYHLYNRDILEQYLLQSTKLERASSTRHDYGSLYLHDGTMYLNLNLQIRFYTPSQMKKKYKNI
ncbi:MAG: HpaII family restriction endonuclease [Succinivibrionaceae bacterium]